MPSAVVRKWNPDKVRELLQSLEDVYGAALTEPQSDPMDELVSCILSQHTSDANSFPAFERLKKIYPTWAQMVSAGQEAIADVIRSAGLANQKSRTILRCLEAIKDRVGEYSIDHLRSMPMIEARNWLTELPGIGPKTASIVLCFSFGMGAIPVDTHVFRVSWRLGLVEEKLGEGKAHDALLKLVPPDLAYRFHMALIQHGRNVCRAPLPDCAQCKVSEVCHWFAMGGPEKRKKELKAKREKSSAKTKVSRAKKRAG